MKNFLLFMLFTLMVSSVHSQPTVGGIAFVAFTTDGTSDGFAFVLLQSAPNNTEVFFDENEWTGSAFNNSNEGVLKWTNNTGGTLNSGTVITVSGLNGSVSSSSGTLSVESGSFNLNQSNEALYAYMGTAANPSVFLAAIATDDFSAAGATLTGTGLTVGTTASEMDLIDADADVGNYIGSTDCTGQTLIDCATMFNTVNNTNWETFDTGSNDSGNFDPIPSATITGNYGALPIELLLFRVMNQNNNIFIVWQTASEINNHYMAVERSHDSKTWSEIGMVEGAGTTYETQNYEFIDEAPLRGVNYYRLRQVNFDGATDYSTIVSVQFGDNEGAINVYPNPTSVELTLEMEETWEGEKEILIFDISGKLMQISFVDNLKATINIADLPNGFYQLMVKNGTATQSQTFVKQ